jgi:hypothetical protein
MLSLVLAPLTANAQDVKRECVDASTVGQTSRDAGQLLKAREQFLVCGRDACPGVVRSSCQRWLAEVEEQTPSVVVRVADAEGGDITDGTATIDGVEHPLDGKPVLLDPGKHVVAVTGHDGSRVEKKLLLATGEKSRLVEVRLEMAKPSGAGKSSGAASEAPPHGPTEERAGIPTGAWVLGGVSVLAFGSFGVFGLSARSELDKLKKACSPSCTEEQTKTGRTNALVADISLGVGVAALAGAVTWALLSRPSSPETTSTARLSVVPLERGGYASLNATF